MEDNITDSKIFILWFCVLLIKQSCVLVIVTIWIFSEYSGKTGKLFLNIKNAWMKTEMHNMNFDFSKFFLSLSGSVGWKIKYKRLRNVWDFYVVKFRKWRWVQLYVVPVYSIVNIPRAVRVPVRFWDSSTDK